MGKGKGDPDYPRQAEIIQWLSEHGEFGGRWIAIDGRPEWCEVDPYRRIWLTRRKLAKVVSWSEFAGDASGSANPGILGQIPVGAIKLLPKEAPKTARLSTEKHLPRKALDRKPHDSYGSFRSGGKPRLRACFRWRQLLRRNQFHIWKIARVAPHVTGQNRPAFGLRLGTDEEVG